MSVESAKEFILRVGTDEEFRERIANASSPEEGKRIAQEAGYDFTDEDYQTATSQIIESESPEGELSDEQLESVAGGVLNWSGIQSQLIAAYGVVWSGGWQSWLKGFRA